MAGAGTRCAICFEGLGQGIELPCSCKVDYCLQCWDKALAKSFNACAKPRCPTCRSPVRVDFDAQTGNLIFTAESDDEDADQTRRRISELMAPIQVRRLEDFGAIHPLDEEASQGGVTAASSFAGRLAESRELPRCVCGCGLERVSLRERARRFFVQAGQWLDSERLAPVLAQGLVRIVCDLCGEPLDLEQPFVWVCERGDSTIKHATSNDICTRCLVRHAWGVEEQLEATEEPLPKEPEPERPSP
uniref:RING-type domain-containing protein n=1 Tax=Alexandrium catenella TaxID=2925 RepID=A0A7S1WQY9_ALECA